MDGKAELTAEGAALDMASSRRHLFWKALLVFVFALVALAIAIPNILMSKYFGPATPAESTFRTINTAEITYAATYPKLGYAPNLSVLGCVDIDMNHVNSKHACLLDTVVGCPAGIGTGWCVKSGIRYNVQSNSLRPPYKDYWVTSSPVEANPKHKNYCVGPDTVVRSEPARVLTVPYTLAECLALPVDPSYTYRLN